MEVNARLLVVIAVILTNIYVTYSLYPLPPGPGKCGLMGMDKIIHIHLLSIISFSIVF